MFKFALAKELGKTLEEINQMTVAEFVGWAGYFDILSEDMKKSMR